MNFMDIMSSKFADLSCSDLKKEKGKIESEMKRRQDIRIREINSKYKEKERAIRARFNEMAAELGTAIPVDIKFTEEIGNRLVNYFVTISEQYCRYFVHYDRMYFPDISSRILDLLSILKEDKEHNLIIALAMQLELKKLEDEKSLEISKVREV